MKAVIIGAGPAGLTAALEMLRHTSIKPVIYEAEDFLGGISRTLNYKGNHIDIGGHRFFSKSDWVMKWWQEIMPIQGRPCLHDPVMNEFHAQSKKIIYPAGGPDPEREDAVMLLRYRVSRIYHLRKFFDYPITLSGTTIGNLGAARILKIGASYAAAQVRPIRPERSLEDFFINRFGLELYQTFFRDYTEKVWGVSCREIPPEWGAQRIKGLSIGKALAHSVRKLLTPAGTVNQKGTETSLIERFLYPKYGPGQMWDSVAGQVLQAGGEIHRGRSVVGLRHDGRRIQSALVRDAAGRTETVEGDFFVSSMPVRELVEALAPGVPDAVRDVARGLVYRDFFTVGLLVSGLKIDNPHYRARTACRIPDNWIYVQESDVRLGRIQIFNNWSPYMIADPGKIWLGLEYFCNEGDDLWTMDDAARVRFAAAELARIGIIDERAVEDAVVLRVKKAYPAYFGSYDHFGVIREWVDGIENLFLVGRNGMHRYNNMDHSMLTARTAAQNAAAGVTAKENIWNINTEAEYQEE